MAPTAHLEHRKARRAAATAGRLLLVGALAALGACADRVVQTGSTSAYPADYRERHPIALTQTPAVLDVMIRGAGLDRRQATDVADFAARYRDGGSGALHVQVPEGGDEIGTRRTLEGVRATLAQAGVPAGYLSVSRYRPGNTELAAAIRLSFRQLEARVQSRCGLWPQDLGVSDAAFNLRNEPHWNLGCATQTNLAAQIADPVDLVRARTPTPIDANSRLPDIEAIRAAEYPATSFPDE